MADRLKVYHRKVAGDSNLPLPTGFWHLATCLRSIVISDRPDNPQSLEPYDLMTGEDAYEFLLKIICGLDSPLLGETEVLGQFKDFYKKYEADFSSAVRDILQNLNRDAKKIRASFLQNLGCTSYGSLLRKQLKGKNTALTMLGAGSLAQDILPWFAKAENQVRVYTRRPENYPELADLKNVILQDYTNIETPATGGLLVVAAPVSAEWLESQFDLNQFDQIYDLRGDSQTNPLKGDHVTPLHILFANIENNKRQAARIKEKAISAIREHANLLKTIERPRPFGWDDLWAYS